MCGICGVFSLRSEGLGDDSLIIQHMVQTLYHRGPDDEGYYLDDFALLGTRRLSIIDLATGQQPVSNEDNSIQLIYNGAASRYRSYIQIKERLGSYRPRLRGIWLPVRREIQRDVCLCRMGHM
jgi:asparagine synthase (glutamine-hydrolysing)